MAQLKSLASFSGKDISAVCGKRLRVKLPACRSGMSRGTIECSMSVSRRSILQIAAASQVISTRGVRAFAAATEQASEIPFKTLNDGTKMPMLGLGTWRMEPDVAESAVETALKSGYKHLDCAKVYSNEEGVGRGIANALRGGVRTRDEIYVTTKLFNDDHSSDRVRAACEEALERLGLNYLDLYLVHWPVTDKPGPKLDPPYKETWTAMEKLVDDGLVKSIGVSNMTAKKVEDLLSYARIKPAVNQIEIHPYWRNEKTRKFCQENDIHCIAYSPLGSINSGSEGSDSQGKRVLENATVLEVSNKLGKTPSQVMLKWLLKQDHTVIPKAATNTHILNNMHLFDFDIPSEDMNKLSSISFQARSVKGDSFCDPKGPYKNPDEMWDGEGY